MDSNATVEDLVRALFDQKQAEDLRHLKEQNRIMLGNK